MSPPKSGAGKPRWMIALVVLLASLAVLCGGPVTLWTWRRSNAFAELEERRDALRERGLPVDDASLEAYRVELMGQQNSERWMAILETVDSPAFAATYEQVPVLGVVEDEQPFVPGQPYPHDQQVRAFLESNQALRQEIHDVTAGSGAIWTEIEFDSFNTLLTYVQASRGVARLISLEFDDAVRRGDGGQVFRSLQSLIGISRSLEQEPVLIAQLVHIALTAMAVQKVKVAVEENLLDDAQLGEVLKQLRTFDDFGRRYRLAIAGERAMALPVFDDLDRFSDTVGEIPAKFNQRPIDALATLDIFAQAEAIPDDDLDSYYNAIVALNDSMEQQFSEAGLLRRFDTLMTNLLMPALAAYGKAVVRHVMQVRLAKLGVAVRLYEKREGELPDQLEQVIAQSALGPVRPYGSDHFGFRISEGNVELWGGEIESPGDQIPDSPASLDETQDSDAIWHWVIRPTR